jgi:hypothetical protein
MIKVHCNELHDLYCSLDIIGVAKSKDMKWERHERDNKCVRQNIRKEITWET